MGAGFLKGELDVMTLPFTWATSVTVFSTRRAASGSGQGPNATLGPNPSRSQSSSARCGAKGASSSTKLSAAARGIGPSEPMSRMNT